VESGKWNVESEEEQYNRQHRIMMMYDVTLGTRYDRCYNTTADSKLQVASYKQTAVLKKRNEKEMEGRDIYAT
jgi:hypothetical protein